MLKLSDVTSVNRVEGLSVTNGTRAMKIDNQIITIFQAIFYLIRSCAMVKFAIFIYRYSSKKKIIKNNGNAYLNLFFK